MSRNKAIIIILCLTIAAVLLAYLVFSIMSSPTTLYVDPKTTRIAVGQDFIINISISNVHDLYGWTFKLNWTATILDAVNVTEGPFLKSGGISTYIQNSTVPGQIAVECTRIGNVPGASGSGVLATIEFNVKSPGQSPLDLYYGLLLNSATPAQAIPFQLSSGEVYS